MNEVKCPLISTGILRPVAPQRNGIIQNPNMQGVMLEFSVCNCIRENCIFFKKENENSGFCKIGRFLDLTIEKQEDRE